MIKTIYEKVVTVLATQPSADQEAVEREAAIRLATAVLMVDVARADHVFDESEFESVLRLIEKHFDLEPEEAAQLVNEAGDVADDLVTIQHFTRRLHEHLDEREKLRIVALLWQVAFADGRLDKYENSLVLKISDLLYVNRARVMRLKHDAEQAG
jgi:uncharacterized tellurite resistance protein B-like protein